MTYRIGLAGCLLAVIVISCGSDSRAAEKAAGEPIRAYCLDFNWGPGGPNSFPASGHWADADPKSHIAWYKQLGCNVIQTFCVSCNGYAWYQGGVVPEQPGLWHDFLPEMIRLGHAEKMRVMGYFCIGSNTRWAKEHPELSYGAPSACHIPFTREYMNYLDWNGKDPAKIVPAALKEGIGLYGFAKPGDNSLLPSPQTYLDRPFNTLTGDERNIAALAWAFRAAASGTPGKR